MTDYYVDPAEPDDSKSGLIGFPKKTISAAMSVAGDGDTIKLIAGTYDDDTQIWSIAFGPKSLTVEPDGSGNITLTRTSEGGTSWWQFLTDRSNYIITFNKIDFVDEKSGGFMFYWNANIGGNVVLNNCSFNCASNGYVVWTHTTNSSIYRRQWKQIDCSLVSGSYTTKVYNFNDMTLIYFKGGTLTNTSTTTTNYLIAAVNNFGPTYILDAGINAKFGINIEHTSYQSDIIRIDGCTLISPDTWQGTGILLDQAAWNETLTVIAAEVTRNYIYNYERGINDYASLSHIHGNIIYCNNPIVMVGGLKSKVFNNTLKSVDATAQGGDGGRCLLLNRREFSNTIGPSNTTFTSTTVQDGSSGWNLSMMPAVGPVYAAVQTSTGAVPLIYYGRVTSVDDGTDTVTVERWIKVSDGSIETPANDTYYVILIRWASQALVENNIMDGSASDHVMTFDFCPYDGQNRIDYNCYNVQPGENLSNLGSVNQADLAALKAKWLAWPEDLLDGYISTSKLNDANSIEADPLFMDTANGDFRLQSELMFGSSADSPCLNTGAPTL